MGTPRAERAALVRLVRCLAPAGALRTGAQMTLRSRIDRIEATRPKSLTCAALELDLPPDLCARIIASQAAGTFPQSLADADLEAIMAAADVARGQT